MSRVLRAAPLILSTSTKKTTNSKADPPDRPPPHSTLREKGEPLTCSPYKQSGGSSGFSPPRPAFSLQTEYLSVVTAGGPLGGSWSGLPWLSYTNRGREPKIRFLTSSPRRASWCLESRLTHRHGFSPRERTFIGTEMWDYTTASKTVKIRNFVRKFEFEWRIARVLQNFQRLWTSCF